jgi:hypothetical protein
LKFSNQIVCKITACLKGVWLLLFFLFTAMKPAGDIGNEYTIKAMFIYNFTKHIDWSQSAGAKTFRIGVIGKSDIIEALEQIASQKKADDKPIEVIQISGEDNLSCQIIFISKSEEKKIDELLKKYSGKGVLIVSEEFKRADHCATINLITTDNKVRFEINQTAARNAGLKISGMLTNLAVAVNP